MPRKRIIDPDFWLDEELTECSKETRLFYIGTWNFSDDYGVVEYAPKRLKAQIFPYDEIDVQPLIQKLIEIGKYIVFEAEGKQWLYIKNFLKWQKVEKPSQKRNPPYRVGEESASTTQPVVSEVKRREVKRSKEDMSDKSDAFEQFWKSYPKKELKKRSSEIWRSKGLDSKLTEILGFIAKASLTDRWKKGFVKQPTTFLNGECWNDDLSSYGGVEEHQTAKKERIVNGVKEIFMDGTGWVKMFTR